MNVGLTAQDLDLIHLKHSAPIYVNFNINEQEVLNIRADMRRLGMTAEELKQYPIEVGLQTDKGYPYRGTLNYVSPSIDRATGTLAVRAILGNSDQVLVRATSCACGLAPPTSRNPCWSRMPR